MPLPLGKGRPQGRPASARLTQPVGLSPETRSHPPHRTVGAALPGQSRGSWVPVPQGLLTQLLTLPSNPCHRLLPARRLSLPLPSPRSPVVSPGSRPPGPPLHIPCCACPRAGPWSSAAARARTRTQTSPRAQNAGHQSILASRHLVCSRNIFISLLFTFWPCLSACGIFVP